MTFAIRIMLALSVFAVILDLSSCAIIRRAQLSQREDEDWRKDFDQMTAGPLNRNRHTVNLIDRKRFKIYPSDWDRLKKNLYILDWDRSTIDPLDRFRYDVDLLDWLRLLTDPPDFDIFMTDPPDLDIFMTDPPDLDGFTIDPHDLDVTTKNPFDFKEKTTTVISKKSTRLPWDWDIDEDNDKDNGRFIITEDNVHPEKSHASTIVIAVLVPVIVVMLVVLALKCIIHGCKLERYYSRTTRTPSPRPVYTLSQSALDQFHLQSETGWNPPSNETRNSNDVLDKPPSYSEIVFSDFSGGQISFPAVQSEIQVPEMPPPKYEETEMIKY